MLTLHGFQTTDLSEKSYGDITSILLPAGDGGSKGGDLCDTVGGVCRFRGVQLYPLGAVVYVS